MTNRPLIHHTDTTDWIPLAAGLSFKPITFFPDDVGYQLLLRLEPGTVIPRHRHTGVVHAFVLAGQYQVAGSDEVMGPGTYVHEPIDTVDTWGAVGTEPCVLHLEVNGRIEYLDDETNAVLRHTDAATARTTYVNWCRRQGLALRSDLVGATAR